jgi:hypothetical protein
VPIAKTLEISWLILNRAALFSIKIELIEVPFRDQIGLLEPHLYPRLGRLRAKENKILDLEGL